MNTLGTILEKGYAIDRLVGEGGFGQVYYGYQKYLEREVAIKVIMPHFANQPLFIQRFHTEAQIIARLGHPHIVPLYDYWRDPDGAYLVMRWLEGGDLRRLLNGKPISTVQAVRMAEQVALALSAAHRKNVVHRDLKPENIMLDQDGNAYLTDFGIAKDLTGGGTPEEDGQLTGSPTYISPEQLVGEPATPQADIYSLGIILYELLTWTRPFQTESINSLIVQKLYDPIPALKDANRLDLIIQRATAKDLSARFQDASDMVVELRQVLRELEYQAPTDAVAEAVESIKIEDLANPFKGLRPFETSDADTFFGREVLIGELLDLLLQNHPLGRFLAVVGPSGIGKSSVVKAGLLPALKQRPQTAMWFVSEFTPGVAPIRELATALIQVAARPVMGVLERLYATPEGLVDMARAILPTPDDQLLLVIDQFEEVFTLAEDPREAQHFLQLLVKAVKEPRSPVRVIITLRADFYDRPLLVPAFSELMSQRTAAVRPLLPEELERTIREPLQKVGAKFEREMVEAIVADVKEEPGALPLLQYALTELFEGTHGTTLTLASYEAIGRVSGALARRADDLYNQLDATSQALTKQLFLRLVTLGEGKEDTRRRVNLQELLALKYERLVIQGVFDLFGKHRLLTFDNDPSTRTPTVEIAHEALITHWKRFHEWLETERESIRLQRRLAVLAEEWSKAGRDRSFLLRGVQLSQFELWAEQTDLVLTAAENEFLQASLAEQHQQLALEQARQAKEAALEQRARRIQRNLVIVLSIATIGAILLTIFALLQRNDAIRAQSDAEKSASTAIAAQAVAVEQADAAATAAAIAQNRADELQSVALAEQATRALAGENPDLALPLVLAANEMPNPPVVSQRLLGEVIKASTVRLIDVSAVQAQLLTSVDVNEQGQLLTASGDGNLVLWDMATGELLSKISTGAGQITAAIFAPQGIVFASSDGTVMLWDWQADRALQRFEGHTGAVLSLDISGQRLATGGRDSSVILWDLNTGEMLQRWQGHSDRVTSVVFSPNGNQVLSGSADATLILWAVETGEALRQLAGHNAAISSVAISPNGLQALSSSSDGVIRLWDLAQGQILRSLEGHTDPVTSVAFSPDGQLALSTSGSPFAGASRENAILLWEVSTGLQVKRFRGHRTQVTDAVFSPDGQQVISISADLSIRFWAVESDLELQSWQLEDGIRAFDLYQAGVLLVTEGNQFVLWREGIIQQQFTAAPLRTVNAVAVSPDGTLAAVASADRFVSLWNIDPTSPDFGQQVRQLDEHTAAVTSVAWTPDGRYLLSGGQDRQMILWDAATGDLVLIFDTLHTNIINALAVSPDGRQVLSASSDRSVMLWDIESGAMLRRFTGHENEVTSVAWSPDGKTFVSGSSDKTLIHWNAVNGAILSHFGDGSTTGHTDWVQKVAFSPDGTRLLSSSRDRTLRIWELASGQEIQRLDTTLLTEIAISEDSQTLFTANDRGSFQQWAFSSAALLEWTRNHRYIYELSCAEREQFAVPPLCEQANDQPE